jgi:hypothetical protein
MTYLAWVTTLVDPLAGEVHQLLEVLLSAEGLSLEACHLADGGGRVVLGLATHDGSQRRIDTEAFGIVDIVLARQAAVDRLPQQGRQGMLRILLRPGIV